MSDTHEIDLVTAEVIRSAMETVCFEMATYVSRTATTPILNQSNERNATILDGQGRLAALSVGIPQFMLSSTLPVRFAIDFFSDELKPGDVIVANDPYHGGGHLPDFNVFAPVFDDEGELLLVASIQCHHGDTGGAVPGGYNTMAKDVYSEGTRYPLLKIIDGGHERRDVILTMRANNRLAGFIGDLRSQVGAAQLGAARLQELAAHWGARTVRAAVEHTIDDARTRFSEEIGGWPDGTYEADIYVDSDPQGNQDLHVHIAVTVDGDRLILDFDGSDDAPVHLGVVHLRQHPRQRHRPAGQPGRSVHPEERGLLRLCRAPRAAGLLPQPRGAEARQLGHPSPRCRGRRRHRRRHGADHSGALRPPDLQVREPEADVGRRRSPHGTALLRPRR